MLMGFRSGYPQIEHLGTLSCFKPKDSEQHVQEGLSDLRLKQVISPSCARCPPSTQRKKASLSLKTRDTDRSLNKQAFLSVPQFAPLASHPLSPFHNFALSSKANMKRLRFNGVFGSFPYEGSCVT